MLDLGQTSGNLTAATDRLSELFQARNIALYPDPDVREAVLNASVKESARGYRLAEETPSKKIDLCATHSVACLTAIREYGGRVERYEYTSVPRYSNPNPNNLGAQAELEDMQSRGSPRAWGM